MNFAKIDRTTSGVIVPAVATRKIEVLGFAFTLDGAGTIAFQSADEDISGDMPFNDRGGMAAPTAKYPYMVTAAGEALNMALAGTSGVKGFIVYRYSFGG
jgi:hypothetical protein